MLTEEQKLKIGEQVVQVLHTVYDPEIPVDIYDLGLIYDIMIGDQGEVKIIMTLTTPNCPVIESLPDEVKDKVGMLEGVKEVILEITFDPPWNLTMMSEEAKLQLGFL